MIYIYIYIICNMNGIIWHYISLYINIDQHMSLYIYISLCIIIYHYISLYIILYIIIVYVVHHVVLHALTLHGEQVACPRPSKGQTPQQLQNVEVRAESEGFCRSVAANHRDFVEDIIENSLWTCPGNPLETYLLCASSSCQRSCDKSVHSVI